MLELSGDRPMAVKASTKRVEVADQHEIGRGGDADAPAGRAALHGGDHRHVHAREPGQRGVQVAR